MVFKRSKVEEKKLDHVLLYEQANGDMEPVFTFPHITYSYPMKGGGTWNVVFQPRWQRAGRVSDAPLSC